MHAPLYTKLLEYSSSHMPFHMPGHKFGSTMDLNKINLFKIDNTEAEGLDNLYVAEGIIKEAEELMADFYGANQTIFLTNGSTQGIITSIMAICKEGDTLIVARNAHHSVWSGLILTGAIPIYINPKYQLQDDILGQITVEEVERALKAYPKAKGVLIVNPTYEGICSDIEGIAEVVHKYDKILIVDEAHGAHFVLDDTFPKSSIKQGADLIINSMHKTLPTLTQSALLHLNTFKIGYEHVIECLRMTQTSSPSYAMMGLMDYIRDYMIEHKGEIKEKYIIPLCSMRNSLKKLKVLKLVSSQETEYDITKMIISTLQANINGYELARQLNRYHIAVEVALESYVILMTTVADTVFTLNYLADVLLKIDSELKNQINKKRVNDFLSYDIHQAQSPRRIYYGNKKWTNLTQCKGRISAKNIMLYPPGIPIVCIGEIISEECIRLIKRLRDKLQEIKIENDEIYLYTLE